MCAFVVLGLVFPYQAKRLAWGTSLKWRILCQVGRKTLTQCGVLDLGKFWMLLCHVWPSQQLLSLYFFLLLSFMSV